MNIIYFLNFYPTKHKLVAHDEMLELARRGHRITAISVWGGLKDKAVDSPFDVIHLKNGIKIPVIINLLFKYPAKILKHFILLKRHLGFRDTFKFLSSYKIFIKIHPDRIHAHFANNAALKGYLLSQFLEVPFGCTGHGSEILLYPEPYLKELILNAEPFITISQYNKKILINRYNIPEDEIKVNYVGIDTEYFHRQGRHYPSFFSILSVTAMRKVKGVRYLIEACEKLKKKGVVFKCVIVGDGEDYDEMFKLAGDLHLEKQVVFTGPVDQGKIRDYLLNASIFVLPSLSEGIPVSIMEAMAMEVPVVATRITGIPEIIEDGENGFMFEPEYSEALAEKMLFLYENPEIVIKVGKKGRKTVEEKFNLKKNVDRFLKLLIVDM